ncbi:hypothetical protein BpJC7_28430 [Weizmannia acidilactici]|uniref:DUF2292 domain-containing protein n=1 Tax=Weizmannia acidilactici TaxID=2607726 RepID=A0A5J4JLN3_9BACI|nr:YezD family protein [Weizmannia acidilactici]GER67734.1 hypothetical protein BpJC4_22050 [Weizmannia acidilactici]GER71540.1 hypothetical protein BpJC7_28430 [Weizmannia acidilactici]GER73612.1 hypothetical protein BpPP18_16790 [Weizmannia acidilactici]
MAYIDESRLTHIIESLKKLEFGTVIISIHEGSITQIETTEKVRFALEKKKAHIAKQRMS